MTVSGGRPPKGTRPGRRGGGGLQCAGDGRYGFWEGSCLGSFRGLWGHVRVYLEGMESLSFHPGRAFLSSNSTAVPWTVVFEDEGIAGYFYACDRSQTTQEESIMDAMLIYNVSTMQNPEAERIASVQWSKDGLQAALYLDGTAQAMFDFGVRAGY